MTFFDGFMISDAVYMHMNLCACFKVHICAWVHEFKLHSHVCGGIVCDKCLHAYIPLYTLHFLMEIVVLKFSKHFVRIVFTIVDQITLTLV